jgi:hypothetical protein
MQRILLTCLLVVTPGTLMAQAHVHEAGMTMPGGPVQPGQDAYAAVAEVVQILQADSTTDWSKVNLEALRQHLIDMNLVTLGSSVRQSDVPGGLAMDVTGDARTAGSIRRMVHEHAMALGQLADYSAESQEIPGGVRFTVRAKRPDDARTVSMIRGLGFIGLLTVGAHHGVHHLALARGEPMNHMNE